MLDRCIEIAGALPGWLRPAAVVMTHELAQDLGPGPFMEIGVFRGRYLSVLRHVAGTGRRIVGYDLFENGQQDRIFRDFEGLFGEVGDLHLHKVDSTTLTPERVEGDCGGAPVFVSIDASHEAGPVLSDMRLTDAVLAADGIVAMDDFLNPYAIGVNEAFHRFQTADGGGDLAPFLFVSNKLFLCRGARQAEWLARAQAALERLAARSEFETYRKRVEKDQTSLRMLAGRDILVIS